MDNYITFVIMIERIKLLMSVKNLTPAQLANSIGVQRSGISHILSGRNKPSLDFVLKILENFSDLNEAWLLKGKGEMLKSMNMGEISDSLSASGATTATIHAKEESVEAETDRTIESIIVKDDKSEESLEPVTEIDHLIRQKEESGTQREDMKVEKSVPIPRIIKWVAFYDDDSFKEFNRQ